MVFDSFLCWPRTVAGQKVWQKCPEGVRGLDSESKLILYSQKISTRLEFEIVHLLHVFQNRLCLNFVIKKMDKKE